MMKYFFVYFLWKNDPIVNIYTYKTKNEYKRIEDYVTQRVTYVQPSGPCFLEGRGEYPSISYKAVIFCNKFKTTISIPNGRDTASLNIFWKQCFKAGIMLIKQYLQEEECYDIS